MTNKEKLAFKKLNIELSESGEVKNCKFKELQEHSRRHGLPAYCCAEENYLQLMALDSLCEYDKRQLTRVYREYIILDTEYETLNKFIHALEWTAEKAIIK